MITTGLSLTYLQSKSNHQLQITLATLQTEGQYALSHLINEISHAGYLAETSHSQLITGTAPPVTPTFICQNNNQWARMIDQPIYGINDTNKLDQVINYSSCITNKDYLRGDIITLRAMSKRTVSLKEVMSTTNKKHLYFLSSPSTGLIFQGQDYSLNKIDAHLQSLRELQASAYYIGPAIGDSSIACSRAQNYPALFRESLNNQGKPQREEISQGIENLQIYYGIDTDNDYAINYYTSASKELKWPDVVSVRLWLLVRAACPEMGFKNKTTYHLGDQTFTPNDGYRRLLLTTTVTIGNK